MQKIIAFVSIGTIAVLALFWNQSTEIRAEEGVATYQIENPSCSECKNTLSVAIENILGIENYTLNEEKNTLFIKYNSEVMEEEWIEKSLAENGYKIKEM